MLRIRTPFDSLAHWLAIHLREGRQLLGGSRHRARSSNLLQFQHTLALLVGHLARNYHLPHVGALFAAVITIMYWLLGLRFDISDRQNDSDNQDDSDDDDYDFDGPGGGAGGGAGNRPPHGRGPGGNGPRGHGSTPGRDFDARSDVPTLRVGQQRGFMPPVLTSALSSGFCIPPPDLLNVRVGAGSVPDAVAEALAQERRSIYREFTDHDSERESCGFETVISQWWERGLIAGRLARHLLLKGRMIGRIRIGNVIALHLCVGIETHLLEPQMSVDDGEVVATLARYRFQPDDPNINLILDPSPSDLDSGAEQVRQAIWRCFITEFQAGIRLGLVLIGNRYDFTHAAEMHLFDGHLQPISLGPTSNWESGMADRWREEAHCVLDSLSGDFGLRGIPGTVDNDYSDALLAADLGNWTGYARAGSLTYSMRSARVASTTNWFPTRACEVLSLVADRIELEVLVARRCKVIELKSIETQHRADRRCGRSIVSEFQAEWRRAIRLVDDDFQSRLRVFFTVGGVAAGAQDPYP